MSSGPINERMKFAREREDPDVRSEARARDLDVRRAVGDLKLFI